MEFFNFLLGILPGSVGCFFGLKMRRIVLALAWFVVGYFGLAFFIENSAIADSLKIVLQIGLGLVLAIFSTKLQKASWFILLFVVGFSMILIALPDAWYTTVIAIIVGIIFGAIAVYVYEPMIVISTALMGAYSIAVSISNFFGLNSLIALVIIFIVLAASGIYVQFSSWKSKK